MTKIKDVIAYLNKLVPLNFQESWDNSGLLVGNQNNTVSSGLLSVDVTEDIIEEAKVKGANLIVAHHPIIFKGLKSLTGKNYVERTVIKAIQADIAIYVLHTNLDVLPQGISHQLAEKLRLKNTVPIDASPVSLKKISVFVPKDYVQEVSLAMFDAGAGQIGNYDHCSFWTEGEGHFRALDGTNPFVGEQGEDHSEPEIKVEVICADYLVSQVVAAIKQKHPYEEVAYDIYPLDLKDDRVGLGKIGVLETEMSEADFFDYVKKHLNIKNFRHSPLLNKKIKTVAVCGGSGSFLTSKVKHKADAYITADIKYHEFFDAENDILLLDVGHYESEHFCKEIFYDIINKKFSNFAVHFSEINTNPINFS